MLCNKNQHRYKVALKTRKLRSRKEAVRCRVLSAQLPFHLEFGPMIPLKQIGDSLTPGSEDPGLIFL